MWTNVFRIAELQTVSWFQFLPIEPDPSTTSERSSKAEQKDSLNSIVLLAHLHLQSEGFLSTWTNSFVGPWDPSQGEHNPDEKIKLWLFLPGRHSSISETAQAAVAKLRVVSNGLWVAPGSSEEVAAALSQALRNLIERALRGLSYVRFGDVFTRYNLPTRNENSFRRAQPTIEFVFAATEEAIFVHVVISARYMRNLCSDDIEKVLMRSPRSVGEGLPVVVAPGGMLGRLVGCCPSDLVKQVYSSKLSSANLPSFTKHTTCQLRGQSYYVEVALGFPAASTNNKVPELDNHNQIKKDLDSTNDPQLVTDGQQKLESADSLPALERTFIYPPEAVVVPMVHQAFVRSSSKRVWLQGWMGSSWEAWPFWNFSSSSYFENCFFPGSSRGLGVNSNFLKLRRHRNSSCNSMSSSISSVSSTSNGSEHAVAAEGGDLEADADSMACPPSDLPSNNQFDISGSKVSKRARSDMTEVSSHAGKEVRENMQGANAQGGCLWGWDEDGVVMDINLLLSEFGDFSDFFQDEELDFGEPPGTAESHALAFPNSDGGDTVFTDSPSTAIDIPEQRLSPVVLTSLEAFNHQNVAPIQDVISKVQDPQKDMASPAGSQPMVLSSSKFDYLTKAEAMLTFAQEYAAVEVPASEMSTSLFTNPYQPRSKKPGSSSFSSRVYSYDVTCSSQMEPSEDKPEKSVKLTYLSHDVGSSKLYTLVQSGKMESDKRLNNTDVHSSKGETSSPVSGVTSFSSSLVLQKKSDSMFDAGYFLLSIKTAFATEIECITFQAAMCRIRHTLLSLRSKASTELKSAMSNLIQTEVSGKSDLMIPKYDIKKKENIPVRLSSDVDHEIYDASLMANVGVWRPVGAPKGPKPLESLSVKTFTGKSPNPCVQRQPVVDLLSAMALLVQQSSSFADIALDMDDGDGSYFWLSLEEQKRRGFSCDPSMVHAGCGGLLATCHSKDCAGVDLVDPLAAEVSESSRISLLQSDIKAALKTAFANMDGPLSVIDWCRGRSNVADSAATGDAYSFQYSSSDIRESSSTISIGGDPMSPPQSSSGLSSNREGARSDDSSQRRSNMDTGTSELEHQKGYHRVRPTIAAIPSPSLLVGYQDDWLKTSVNCIKLWEKAPLEPYASPKPVTYYALCPDIDILTSAATDFFLQLGTIYEVCKLGTHSPQNSGGQMELSPGKYLPSGLVIVECPEQVKSGGSHSSAVSSISDYLQALSKHWSVKSFVTSMVRIIKDLKLTSNISTNQKESSSGPCTVIYVVCPFPEPSAVLETLIECSVALGSVILSPERERKSFLYSQVAKALNCSASADEASASNVVMLSGFSIPKLVLQMVTVETLLRLHKPNNELAVLKDMAFTVYNKARRIPRAISTSDMFQSSTYIGRSQPAMMHVTSPGPTIWKECMVPRMSGPTLSRDAEFDGSMRSVTWDNSWQPARAGGLLDPNKLTDLCVQDDKKYAFEPLFILAESGSVDNNAVLECTKSGVDSSGGVYNSISGGSSDSGVSLLLEGSESDTATSLHCCYGWTEDWRWLVCIWTDSRGELLDSLIFPFGGISSRQDTKVLQSLFIQILQQGCQILSSSEAGNMRPRDIVITRLGGFFELEIQEWQKAIYSFGGNEVKKWPVQLRRSIPEGIPSSANGPTLQQQEMSLIQDRNMPSSPSPLYSPHSKSSFMKGALGQPSNKKQILVEQTGMDSSRGSLHLVRSISLVAISLDHSLHLTLQADLSSKSTSGEGNQNSNAPSSYLEGFTPVKSIGSMSASYLLVPSPSMRYLSPTSLQLPTCLTSESPPLAHLLHSKGTAIPLAMGYVVSKAVPPVRKDSSQLIREDRPSVLSINIVDHYGGSVVTVQDKMSRGVGGNNMSKQTRNFTQETATRDYEMEMHNLLESVAAELHSLSWMTVSPVFIERRTALPFHCDMVLRLRRLLHHADRYLSQPTEQADVA